MEIVLYVDDAWVLEVLLLADGSLCAIRMGRSEEVPESSNFLGGIACHGDVLLLVHSLQLCMEATDDHVLKAVALHLGPVFYLIVWDVLHVAGDIIAGIGVCSLATDARHELVVLVGDVVFGSQL